MTPLNIPGATGQETAQPHGRLLTGRLTIHDRECRAGTADPMTAKLHFGQDFVNSRIGHDYIGPMTTREFVAIRSFSDRAEALGHLLVRSGEAPRFLAFDDVAGCPVDIALAALEWTGVVGLLLDDDLLHAAQLTSETASTLIERRDHEGRRFLYVGPRLDAVPMDIFEGRVLFEEPGVKVVEFAQRSHALGHFFRATVGDGALVSMLGRRAPELRHLRRWFGPIVGELDGPSQLLGGWFASSAGGALFVTGSPSEPVYRYIEVGLES